MSKIIIKRISTAEAYNKSNNFVICNIGTHKNSIFIKTSKTTRLYLKLNILVLFILLC